MFKKSPEAAAHERLGRYVDPTGELTNRDLALGEWYVRHRVMLREIVVGILIAIIVIFGGFSLFKVGDYAIFGYWNDEQLRTDLTKNTVALKNIQASQSPVALDVAATEMYPGATGKYDIVALAKNTNERWIANVSYTFVFDGGQTPAGRATILPGKTLPLSALGTLAASISGNVRLTITSIDWRQLDNHRYPRPDDFMAERLQFQVRDFSFRPADPNLGTVANLISFKLKNDSAYGYVQTSLYALLKSGDTVVGVKRFFVDGFRAGEERTIDLASFADSLSVDGLEIIPDIDIFSGDSYLPAGT